MTECLENVDLELATISELSGLTIGGEWKKLLASATADKPG
jgi:hypothetical protein